MNKVCRRCGETKGVDHFTKDAKRKDGLQSWCRECKAIMLREYRASDKGRAAIRKTKLKGLYGIDETAYNEMLAKQGGVCAICGMKETVGGRRLAVDHCHSTGAVRGLLCNACNIGIGKLKDSPELLTKALKYLQESNNVHS